MKTGPKPQTFEKVLIKLEERSYIDENGCLIWQGCTSGLGYGCIRCDNEGWYIHRLIFREFICEEVPEVVMHTCDTPRCWNYEHLVGGTHADNVQDKINKDRHLYGEKSPNAVVNEKMVRIIREDAKTLGLPLLVKKYAPLSKGGIYNIIKGVTWKLFYIASKDIR